MMRYKSTFMLTVLVMCASFAVAHADVKYTKVDKFVYSSSVGNKSKHDAQITETHFVTANKSREDREVSETINPVTTNRKQTTITRCDLHQQFRVDNNLKIYTVSQLPSKSPTSPSSPSSSKSAKPKVSKGTLSTGKVVTRISIQKLTPEKVDGIDTEGYQLTLQMQESGCIGNRHSSFTSKIWVANIKDYHQCDQMESPRLSYTISQKTAKGKCNISYETVGDIKELEMLNSPPMLKMREESTSKNVTSNTEVTSLSQAKLSDNLFDIPTNYRKVSLEEYQKLWRPIKEKTIQEKQKIKTQQ